jgi:hypothetical protein
MQIDGDRLNISLDLKYDEIDELRKFVLPRLEYIEEVGFESADDDFPTSSAIIAFLISLKKSKPSLKIDMLDNQEHTFKKYGTAHWICHE